MTYGGKVMPWRATTRVEAEAARVARILWERRQPIYGDGEGLIQVMGIAWFLWGDELVYQLVREGRRVGYWILANAIGLSTSDQVGAEWLSDRVNNGYFYTSGHSANLNGIVRSGLCLCDWVPSWSSADAHRWLYLTFPGIRGERGDRLKQERQRERLQAINQGRLTLKAESRAKPAEFRGLDA